MKIPRRRRWDFHPFGSCAGVPLERADELLRDRPDLCLAVEAVVCVAEADLKLLVEDALKRYFQLMLSAFVHGCSDLESVDAFYGRRSFDETNFLDFGVDRFDELGGDVLENIEVDRVEAVLHQVYLDDNIGVLHVVLFSCRRTRGLTAFSLSGGTLLL